MPDKAPSRTANANLSKTKPVDLHLLERFVRLVDVGGFTAARTVLNVRSSTLSGQIATLERQLGMRLCERGRGGFRLTEHGRLIYQSAQRVFGAVGKLESDIAEAGGKFAGSLTVGMVDNIATNPACRLSAALTNFRRVAPDVSLILKVSSPAELEQAVFHGEYAVAIGVFQGKDRGLRYTPLFSEQQYLYCGATHPLFGRTDDRISRDELRQFDYVARGYLHKQVPGLRTAATAWHMEAIALMVQSGTYLGHLPAHYAERWESLRLMQSVLPDAMGYVSRFACVTSRSRRNSPVVDALTKSITDAHPA